MDRQPVPDPVLRRESVNDDHVDVLQYEMAVPDPKYLRGRVHPALHTWSQGGRPVGVRLERSAGERGQVGARGDD